MVTDLHCHSDASDGVLTPLELLARARNNGVSRLAVTDHDTVEGVLSIERQLAAEVDVSDMEFVPGVEITALAGKQTVHLLGLWIDAHDDALRRFLDGQRQIRQLRGEAIAAKLASVGFKDVLAGALKIADGAALNRPHFAKYLVEAGYCDLEQQAFRKWLGAGKVADVACAWPSLENVVAVIHAAGGLAVLAHPDKYGVTRTKKDQLLARFRAAGGDGLELVSGMQSSHQTEDLLRLAIKHGLACSTGSDFHSPSQTWSELGAQPQLPEQALPIWACLREADNKLRYHAG